MNIKHRKNETAPDQSQRHEKLLNRLAVNPKRVYLDFTDIHDKFEQSIYQRVQKRLNRPSNLFEQLKDKTIKGSRSQSYQTNRNAKCHKAPPRLIDYGRTRAQKLKENYRSISQPKVEPKRFQLQPPPSTAKLFERRAKSLDATKTTVRHKRTPSLSSTAGSGGKRYKIDPNSIYAG